MIILLIEHSDLGVTLLGVWLVVKLNKLGPVDIYGLSPVINAF